MHNQGAGRIAFFWRLRQRIRSMLLSCFLGLPSSLACSRTTPTSASVFTQLFTWPSPLCLCVSSLSLSPIRTWVIGFRAHPSPGESHPKKVNHVCEDYFQTRSYSQVMSVGTWTYPILPTTRANAPPVSLRGEW